MANDSDQGVLPGIPDLETKGSDNPEALPPMEGEGAPPIEGADATSSEGAPSREGVGRGGWTHHKDGTPRKKAKAKSGAAKRKARLEREAATEPEGPSLEETEQNLAAALAFGFQSSFGILAKRRGPHWRLGEDEAAGLGSAWGKALAPFMANAGPYSAFIVAGLVTAGVVLPRMALELREPVEAPQIASPPPPAPDGPPGSKAGHLEPFGPGVKVPPIEPPPGAPPRARRGGKDG